MPLAHLAAARNRHTFRSGLLLDAERSQAALDALLGYLVAAEPKRHGIEFTNLSLQSRLADELAAAAARHGYRFETDVDHKAPCVHAAEVDESYFQRHWSRSRRKSIRQAREKLGRLGPVSLQLHRHPSAVGNALPTFLRLEAAGWKGADGTACLCNTEDLEFVDEMVTGLAEHGQVVISELCAGSRIVSSAINLLHGDTLFAFKIGWDPDFASVGPGMLHEVELMRAEPICGQVRFLDSCAADDSYIGRVWPERTPIGIGRLTWTPLSIWTSRLTVSLTVVRRFLQT
jgi:CelD/BcsL family acetyltransferase involved in cellulose biosynthesis